MRASFQNSHHAIRFPVNPQNVSKMAQQQDHKACMNESILCSTGAMLSPTTVANIVFYTLLSYTLSQLVIIIIMSIFHAFMGY